MTRIELITKALGHAQGYLRNPLRITRVSDHQGVDPFDCECRACMNARKLLEGIRFALSAARELREEAK